MLLVERLHPAFKVGCIVATEFFQNLACLRSEILKALRPMHQIGRAPAANSRLLNPFLNALVHHSIMA
jgi:hypothetical protein